MGFCLYSVSERLRQLTGRKPDIWKGRMSRQYSRLSAIHGTVRKAVVCLDTVFPRPKATGYKKRRIPNVTVESERKKYLYLFLSKTLTYKKKRKCVSGLQTGQTSGKFSIWPTIDKLYPDRQCISSSQWIEPSAALFWALGIVLAHILKQLTQPSIPQVRQGSVRFNLREEEPPPSPFPFLLYTYSMWPTLQYRILRWKWNYHCW